MTTIEEIEKNAKIAVGKLPANNEINENDSLPKQLLDKYATQVLSKDAIYKSNGRAGVDSKKSFRYSPDKYSEDIVLWKAPNDWIRIEFDGATPDEVKAMMSETESNIKSLGFDYCITYHDGGVSPYINICNIKNIPLTETNKLAKLLFLDMVLDKKSKKHLDRTNLTFTWTPIIEHPHWKPKYSGAKHAIVAGKNPLEHDNEFPKELVKRIKQLEKKSTKVIQKVKLNCKWVEDFLLNYCCNNELPEGNRHSVINKNLAVLIATRENQEEIIGQYHKFNEGAGSVRGWIVAVSRGDIKDVNPLEIKKYIEENEIPYDIKEAKRQTVEEEVVRKAIRFFMDKKDLAEKFIEVQPLYFDKGKNFWIWDFFNKCWLMKDETDVCNLITDNSHADTINATERNEILAALKQAGRKHKPKDFDKNWIQFKGSIVNIKTKEQIEAGHDYFGTNPIPWQIGETSYTPNIDKIFEEWVGKEYVMTLKEIAAYCLLSDYPIHRIFCFLGSGRNGKSKYLKFIEKLLGDDNVSAVELDTLMKSRFEMFNLYKKLAVQMGETNFTTMSRTATLKKLTGQDKVSFEAKGKDPISDVNYAKLLVSTNNLPDSEDKTDGFFRRWICIDFPNEFEEGKEVLDRIPNEEYENFCKASIDLLNNLLKNGRFTNEGTVAERQKRYEERSNPFDKFIKEECEEYDDDFIFKFEFKESYIDWCKKNRFRPPTDRDIANKMKDHGFSEGKEQSKEYDKNTRQFKRYRAWRGLCWKNSGLTETFVKEVETDKQGNRILSENINQVEEEII